MDIPKEVRYQIEHPFFAYTALTLLCIGLILSLLKFFGIISLSWAWVTLPIWVTPVSFVMGFVIILALVFLALTMALVMSVGVIAFLVGIIMIDIPLNILLSSLYNTGLIKKSTKEVET